MKTVVLCGGQGTRMREETEYRPKPLVEVGGRPILWHIMKTYANFGHRDFVLCLGYRGNMIKEYFLNYEAMNNDFTVCLGRQNIVRFEGEHEEQDFNVTLASTGLETMTGGRLRRVKKYVADDDTSRSTSRTTTRFSSPTAMAWLTLTSIAYWRSIRRMAKWQRFRPCVRCRASAS
jgi:glucose-1-phosphate cytidylyltransferase